MHCPDCQSTDFFHFFVNLPGKQRLRCLDCGLRLAFFPASEHVHAFRCGTLRCRLSWQMLLGGKHCCRYAHSPRYYYETTQTTG